MVHFGDQNLGLLFSCLQSQFNQLLNAFPFSL